MAYKRYSYPLVGLLMASMASSVMVSCSPTDQSNQADSPDNTPSSPTATSPVNITSTAPAVAETGAEDGHEHHGNHQNHHNPSAKTQAKLLSASQVPLNQPVPVTIEIQDRQGQVVSDFEIFQEKLMHLIVVSDDLQFYNHIHPEYRQNGRFEVTTTFPQVGKYTLFSDYKPAQQAEEVATVKVQVPGTVEPPPAIDRRLVKTFGDTKATLELSRSEIKAGEDITLSFNLQDATQQEPVKDLEPYLGELGHLVILRKSPALSRADYLHAHALPQQQEGQVQFHTQFPQPGQYKLWGQFQRNGQIVTADFWVDVL